eukprot:COSAG01_NODE_4802_length_4734_cov_2.711111_1_plen_25_part_10
MTAATTAERGSAAAERTAKAAAATA